MYKNTEPLLNPLVIILGGASGIGRAVCQALAAEGASVVVTDLNDQKAEETTECLSKHADSKHLNYSLDVARGEEVQKVLECIISEYRRPPCILVNSAGIISDDLLLKMEEKKFDKVIEVNLKVKISQKNCKQSYYEYPTPFNRIVRCICLMICSWSMRLSLILYNKIRTEFSTTFP